MGHAMIRYRVKPGSLAEHLRLLDAVHEELAATAPAGLRWVTYRLEDGVRFVDVAAFDAPGRFSRLQAWKAYRSTLDARCDEPPVFTELHRVASYDPLAGED